MASSECSFTDEKGNEPAWALNREQQEEREGTRLLKEID